MRAIILGLLIATAALAAPVMASSTATFGMKVLSVGDSVARVYELAGEPSRVVQLENRFGGAIAERFEYFQGSKVIKVTIKDGRVVAIDEVR